MLGIIGKNIPAYDYLTEFRELAEVGRTPMMASSGHQDGWGIVAINEETLYVRSAESALDDPQYTETIHKIGNDFSGVLLAHLRKASRGDRILENSHPFKNENFYFMHNGTIYYPRLRGSDSIKYLEFLRKKRGFLFNKQRDPLIDRIKDYYAYLKKKDIGYSSISSMMATRDTLWAVRAFQREEMYYTIYHKSYNDYVMLTQEMLDDEQSYEEWTLLPQNSIIRIKLEDLAPNLEEF